jgi:hypothetical protein
MTREPEVERLRGPLAKRERSIWRVRTFWWRRNLIPFGTDERFFAPLKGGILTWAFGPAQKGPYGG